MVRRHELTPPRGDPALPRDELRAGLDGERGATLMEFALVAPILFALLAGIIDFSWVVSQKAALRQGARDGAREAIAGEFGTDSGCSPQGTTPASPPLEIQQLICSTKNRIGSAHADVWVAVAVDHASAEPYAVGAPLVVCAQVRIHSMTGLLDPYLSGTFATEVEMRIDEVDPDLTDLAWWNANGRVEESGAPAGWSTCVPR